MTTQGSGCSFWNRTGIRRTSAASGQGFTLTTFLQFLLLLIFLAGCGGGGGGSNDPTYSIGGAISGLDGTVVLQNNGGNNLSRSTNGAFTFSTALTGGSTYAVTVQTQPTGQTCTVSNGSGNVGSANVTSVAVTCIDDPVLTFAVGGTISGLNGTVVLQNNSSNDLSLSADGNFTFANPLVNGGAHAVTVLTQPAGQTCEVTNSSGTVASVDVTNVNVTCADSPVVLEFTIGGAVSGLDGTVVLQNNDGNDLSLSPSRFSYPKRFRNRRWLCSPAMHGRMAPNWSCRIFSSPSARTYSGNGQDIGLSGILGIRPPR